MSEVSSISSEFLLNILKRTFENVSECEMFEIFSNTESLISKFFLQFLPSDIQNDNKFDEFLALLTNISSRAEIIPFLIKMNIGSLILKLFKMTPSSYHLKILDIILNLLCQGSETIKQLLPLLKDFLLSMVLHYSSNEVSKKALQALAVCLICGDEEICIELLTNELFEKILMETENDDVDHAILMVKAVEKTLFFGQILVRNSDEQNCFFEAFCQLGGEETLERLTENPSKTISFLALHIIDTYF